MAQITFYWNIGSQPARAVKTLIDIGQIPCDFIIVDLLKREQRNKQYLDLYPAGKVPILKKGDMILGESGAIMIYLCELYPQISHYQGRTIQQRARVNQYISWYQSYFRLALFKPVRMYMGALMTQQPIWHQQKTRLEKDMWIAVEKLDQLLSLNGTTFLAGENATIADFLFYHEMTNLILLGKNHESFTHVKRWFTDVYKLQEVRKITHEWFKTGQQMRQIFNNVEVQMAKL